MPDGEAASPLEEKLNTISGKLAELEDLQLINKLDIINLKNEIEKLKLTSSTPSPETIENIKELEKLAEHTEEFKKLQGLAGNMDKIMADIKEMRPGGLEDMIRVVDDIDKRLRRLETEGLGMKPGEAEEYAKSIEGLKSGLESLPKGAKGVLQFSKQLERIRLMVEENTKNIWKFSKEKAGKPAPAPRAAPLAKPAKALKCPKCRAGLPAHARFCRKCGAKVS